MPSYYNYTVPVPKGKNLTTKKVGNTTYVYSIFRYRNISYYTDIRVMPILGLCRYCLKLPEKQRKSKRVSAKHLF